MLVKWSLGLPTLRVSEMVPWSTNSSTCETAREVNILQIISPVMLISSQISNCYDPDLSWVFPGGAAVPDDWGREGSRDVHAGGKGRGCRRTGTKVNRHN